MTKQDTLKEKVARAIEAVIDNYPAVDASPSHIRKIRAEWCAQAAITAISEHGSDVDEENPYKSIETCMAMQPRDWCLHHRDAWIWVIVYGADDETLKELAIKHEWDEEAVARLKRLHKAWNTNHTETILRAENERLRDALEECIEWVIHAEAMGSILKAQQAGLAGVKKECEQALQGDDDSMSHNYQGALADCNELAKMVFNAKDLESLQETTKLNYPGVYKDCKL